MSMLQRAAKTRHVAEMYADEALLDKFASAIKPHVSGEMKFLGAGMEHNVFDLGGNKIAKIAYGHSTIPDVEEVLKPIKTIDLGKHTAYVFPKARTTGIRMSDVTQMSKQLEAKGLTFDAHEGNVGFYQGKPVIIDHGGIKKARPLRQGDLRTTAQRTAEVQASSQLVKAVMDSGEGSAISRAGVAPSKKLSGSRTMRGVV
jgi:hypothetical protein